MKWGVRRYENYDGSLTEAGKKRKAKFENKAAKNRKAAKSWAKDSDHWDRFGTRTLSDAAAIKSARRNLVADKQEAIASGDKNRIRKAKKNLRRERVKQVLVRDNVRGAYRRHKKDGSSKVASAAKAVARNYVTPYTNIPGSGLFY